MRTICQCSLVLLFVCEFGLPTAPALPAGEERLYGGRTLPQWRELIKTEPLDSLQRPEIVQGLMEVVADPLAPWADRRQSALTLGRIGPAAQPAIALLQRLLNNDEGDSQATTLWALRALALLGSSAGSATPDVAAIVADASQPFLVRASAMETLARVGASSELTVPTLLAVLRSDQEQENPHTTNDVRLAAAESLGLLGPAAAPALPELLRALQSDWPLLQLGAADTLGRIGVRAEQAIPGLVDAMLFSDAGEVREAAADALGRIGAPALPALEKLLTDHEPEVRRLVIRGVKGTAPSAETERILRSALQDDSELNRIEAAEVLMARLPAGDEACVDILLQGLTSPQRAVRAGAYRVLKTQLAALGPHRQRLKEIRDNPTLPVQSRGAAARLVDLLAP